MGSDRWVGTILGERYQIEELLGQGGMSAVYRANDMNLQRPVAIKLIHPHLTHNAEFVRRFETEATAIAKLRHPNIVQVYDLNHGGDLYYMVLEYVAGETLQDRIKRMNAAGNQLPVPDALGYILQICGAAHYAHQHGMIHRDIKPANIMIDPNGSAILMDFGIARMVEGQEHTATGTLLGTALYMSPEQIQGLHPDARSDIYAIGVTLFEVLSGRPPFEADSVMTLMLKHLHDPVPDLNQLHPGIPEVVKAIVNRALEKSPADRFQSCAEMAEALQQALDVLSGAKPAPPVQKKEKPAAAQETVIEPYPRAAPEHTLLEPVVHQPPAVTDERTVIESATVREPAPARWAEAVQPAAPPARKKRLVWPFAAILVIALLGGGLLFYNQVFLGQRLPLSLAMAPQVSAVTLNTPDAQPIAPVSTSTPTATVKPSDTVVAATATATATIAEATAPPAAPATATNRPTRARVLWDSSHGPHMSSHEDPPTYDPTGVYSSLAMRMLSANISIETNIEDLASLDLTVYQAIVINQWSAERRAYSETEAANLASYVENGGGLLILADLESTNKSVSAVCERFGVQCYRAPAIRSVNSFTVHPITNGLSELIFGVEGGALSTSDRSTVVGAAGGNATIIAIGDLPGRVVIIGDGNLFDNNYLSQKDDAAFALNVFRWITGMSD